MITREISLDLVEISANARPRDPSAVNALAKSISQLGLLNPITVALIQLKNDDGEDKQLYRILAGGHRFEAVKLLGWDTIPALVMDTDDEKTMRMVEISENLHRAELSALERSKLVMEWVILVEEKHDVSRQHDAKPQGGRPEGGKRRAARELGLSESDVRRSLKIAGLSPEAQDAASMLELDNNKSALLAAAKHDDPATQVEILERYGEKKTARRSLKPVVTSELKPEVLSTGFVMPSEIPQHDWPMHIKDMCEHTKEAILYAFLCCEDLMKAAEMVCEYLECGSALDMVQDNIKANPEDIESALRLWRMLGGGE